MFILLANVNKPKSKMHKYSLNKWFMCTFHHFLIPFKFASFLRQMRAFLKEHSGHLFLDKGIWESSESEIVHRLAICGSKKINLILTRFSGQHTTGSSGFGLFAAGSGMAVYKYSKEWCRRFVFLPFDAKNWQERKVGQGSESGG